LGLFKSRKSGARTRLMSHCQGQKMTRELKRAHETFISPDGVRVEGTLDSDTLFSPPVRVMSNFTSFRFRTSGWWNGVLMMEYKSNSDNLDWRPYSNNSWESRYDSNYDYKVDYLLGKSYRHEDGHSYRLRMITYGGSGKCNYELTLFGNQESCWK